MSDTVDLKPSILDIRKQLREQLLAVDRLEVEVEENQTVFDALVNSFLETIPDEVESLETSESDLEQAKENVEKLRDELKVLMVKHYEATGESHPFGKDDSSAEIRFPKKYHYDDEALAKFLLDKKPEFIKWGLKKKEMNKWLPDVFVESDDGEFDLIEEFEDLPVEMKREALCAITNDAVKSSED